MTPDKADNERVETMVPERAVTAGQRPDSGLSRPLAAARGAAAGPPFTARALRELLFCLIEVPLGLSVLAVPAALTGLPLLVAVLARDGRAPASRAQANPPPGVAGFLAPALLAALVALVTLAVLAPRIARRIGAAHRRLAGRMLGEQLTGPPPIGRSRGLASWVSVTLRDGPGWRAVGYLLVKVPLEVLGCYAVVVWWGAGLANLTYPLWWPWFRNHPPGVRLSPVPALTPFGVLHIATLPGTVAAFAAGAATLLAAPWLTRALTATDLWLMRGLLGPGRLAQRVADLEQARALVIDDSAALLRRVERDLHDGAQIRLATLAMNLGMALDTLGASGGQHPDLAEVRDLVGAAHRGAKEALAELRDLARGIHPPALDNGLADALATLTAGSPIPVELAAGIPHRPSPAIETIAYFCAAELLANAVKHSGASKITVTVIGQGERLILQVADDGRGGADPARGSGLAGLAQRTRAVDGRLDVASPPGGPTLVTAELPLHA